MPIFLKFKKEDHSFASNLTNVLFTNEPVETHIQANNKLFVLQWRVTKSTTSSMTDIISATKKCLMPLPPN